MTELNATHRHLQAKCQLVQTSYIKRIILFVLVCHVINGLFTELRLVYRPYCVRSLLTISVKILPYTPPARLMRAKYFAVVVNPFDEILVETLSFRVSCSKHIHSLNVWIFIVYCFDSRSKRLKNACIPKNWLFCSLLIT